MRTLDDSCACAGDTEIESAASMRNVIAGTAGHIDHGKTALVRALTGIDTDRLEEEKRRGISIDLGFAHLDLSSELRIALIDVPGHEKFIKNMLAGVGGIDLVLLVVSAEESIKPQTREHFEICRLLRIPTGVIAVTKSDLVDPDLVQLVRMEVEDFVRGSFLEGAAVVPVSAATGEGLPELRAALAAAALRVPARETLQGFRLWVDRSFTLPGFGPVVTGTVLSGSVAIEQEVEVHPSGTRLRVRGVQVHGMRAGRAGAGQRAAVNLAGPDSDTLARGFALVEAGAFRPTQAFDASIDLLEGIGPVKSRLPVHLHAGTAEVEAEVRFYDAVAPDAPGERFARVVLWETLLVVPGDRFIVRRSSPVETIGGGVVVDAHPPRANRRALEQRARQLAKADLGTRIGLLLREAPHGLRPDVLAERAGIRADVMLRVANSDMRVYGSPPAWLMHRETAERIAAHWLGRLGDFHRENPLLPGIPKEDLRSRDLPGVPPFVFDVLAASNPSIRVTGDVVHLVSHKIALQRDEEDAIARIEAAFRDGGLAVPGTAEVLKSSGVELTRARALLQVLLRNKRLVRTGDDLVFHASALDSLRHALAVRRGSTFSVADFKDWTGVSRKYAIPLLEWLDRERVTRREGDARVIL